MSLPEPVLTSPKSIPALRHSYLIILYAFSGLTSLAYEVLWVRMVSTQFGISIFAVVVTVTAFMAGLGVGSLLGRHIPNLSSHPLRVFALLEGMVALFAFSLPALAAMGGDVLAQWGPDMSLTAWYVLQGAILILILMLPAMAMGAAFPAMLAAGVESDHKLGDFYGANACGAAIGALLPLALLPVLGWSLALQLVAGVGAIIALMAYWLAQGRQRQTERLAATVRIRTPLPIVTTLAYGGIGFSAIMLEIAWTRLFGLVMLRTEYVMAIILAIYVGGIGLGGLLARRLPVHVCTKIFPVFCALWIVTTLWLLPVLSRWVEASVFATLASSLLWQSIALAALTLPVTVVLGAWLPLLNRRFKGNGNSGVSLYGSNAMGSALGAVMAGFVFIPLLGTSMTIISAAVIMMVCGLLIAAGWRWYLALVPLALWAWPVHVFPSAQVLLPASYPSSHDLYRYEDAVSLTHVIEKANGQRLLLSDLQRMDAATDPASVMVQRNQAILPLLLHPAPKRVLFLGLGTGITASASMAYPDLERTAVELSQGAIDAARHWFSAVNQGVMGDMRVIHDDSRRFLLTTEEQFDVIIGDLFHPDLVGRSALLSIQQFERVQRHMAPGAVFVQWLAMNQFSVATMKVVLRTFKAVFPRNMLFVDGFRVAMVGLSDSWQGVGNRQQLDIVRDHLAADDSTGGEGLWTWLGRFWGSIELADGPVQDEWHPRIEYALPQARFSGAIDLTRLIPWLEAQRPDLHMAMRMLMLADTVRPSYERSYAAAALAMRSWFEALQGQGKASIRLLRFAHQANPLDRSVSWALADQMYDTLAEALHHGLSRGEAMARILKVFPDHPETLRDLWRLAVVEGHPDKAEGYLRHYRRISPLGMAKALMSKPLTLEPLEPAMSASVRMNKTPRHDRLIP